jgi:hypothetical protein
MHSSYLQEGEDSVWRPAYPKLFETSLCFLFLSTFNSFCDFVVFGGAGAECMAYSPDDTIVANC